MKKLLVVFSLISACSAYLLACTNFMAGKDATTDGNVYVTYAADSYSLFGFLRFQPAADHAEGEKRKIVDWDTGKPLGEIPQVAHTYSVVGNMNEHQLVIGETTYGGREELYGETGIDYGSLIYIALERCRTAREAIGCMTFLVKEYGYASEGESFTIADTREVWILELIGKGKTEKGAVWAAARIPDDCISAHANQARITQIDFSDRKHVNWMWSEDVVKFARERGYFSGKDKDFSFSDTYNPLDFVGAYICEARVWSFFNHFADVDKHYDYATGKGGERMPLYIRPDRKLSLRDMKICMRDQYEGTPLDITQGTDAGPWHSKLRYGSLGFELDSVKYWYERPIATQQTGWSFVAQIRPNVPDQVGGIFWFGVDDAATSMYVPMYCTIEAVPECFAEGNGDLYTYSSTSAFWAFNKVANWAYTKYSSMFPDIKKVQEQWDNYLENLTPAIEHSVAEMSPKDAKATLTQICANQAEAVTEAWNKLYEYLLVKYLDGQERKETGAPINGRGLFKRNEWGEPVGPNRPPFPEDFLRQIAPEVAHE